MIKRDKGSMAPLACAAIIVILILGVAFFELFKMYAVAAQIDHAVELSVQGVAKENWENIYQGIREGYAGAYTKDKLSDDWKEVINREQILLQMKKMIDFDEEGSEWVKKDDQGRIVFSLKPEETTVKIINTNLAAKEGDALLVETTNRITIPWFFLSSFNMPPIQYERKTVCGYTPKF